MSYAIFTGKQRSLVFPIMCNGFLTLDYSDNISTTDSSASDIKYGLWALDDDFTFECVVTPYDINGFGNYGYNTNTHYPSNGSITRKSAGIGYAYVSTSKKIATGLSKQVYDNSNELDHESERYLSKSSRVDHEMLIFSSSRFSVSLVNDTTHNYNNPSRYKIKVGVKLGTGSMEYFTSDTLIVPNHGVQYSYDSTRLSGFDRESKLKFRNIGATSGTFNSQDEVNLTDADHFTGEDMEVFIQDGFEFKSIGFVESSSSSLLTLKSAPTETVASGTSLFVHSDFLEPAYINNTYHIACSWDNENKIVGIYLDGKLVKSGTHTRTESFEMAEENMFIGANGQGNKQTVDCASTNKQFMGELHELSFMNVRKTSFNGINNLIPNYNNTVLYLRFEEVDE